MRVLKRLICVLITAAMLLGLCACTIPEQDKSVFTTAYAKTADTFFAVRYVEDNAKLYYAPLNDLQHQKAMDLPSIDPAAELERIEICGLTAEHLYVCFIGSHADNYELNLMCLYRISLKTLAFDLLFEDDQASKVLPSVWYNAKSNSLLIGRVDGDHLDIDAFDPDTKERSEIFNGDQILSTLWLYRWNTAPKGVVFLEEVKTDNASESSFIMIDGKNRAAHVNFSFYENAMQADVKKAQNQAENLLRRNDLISYASCAGYTYYVESDTLFRMKTDGTEKTMLNNTMCFTQVLAVNDRLYGLIRAAAVSDDDFEQEKLCALDENGKVIQTIAQGYSGDDNCYGIEALSNRVLMMNHYVYGGLAFHALYDPSTDTLFSGF